MECDWKSILLQIYSPPIGSLWVAPNGIWDNCFAHNKSKAGVHPSVVGRVFSDKRCWLIPGTSKEYNKGSSVYRTKLNPTDVNCPFSHFLISLRMTYTSRDLINLKRGWSGIDSLDESQTEELKLQIKFCLGIDV